MQLILIACEMLLPSSMFTTNYILDSVPTTSLCSILNQLELAHACLNNNKHYDLLLRISIEPVKAAQYYT